MTADPPRSTGAPLLRGGALFAVSIVQVADAQALPLLLPELGAETWREAPLGLLLTAYALGAALIPFALVARFPRLDGSRVAAGALLVLAAALLLFASGPPFAVACGARLLAGGASGVLSFTALGLAARTGHGAVTAQTAGFLVALVLGPSTAAWLAHLSDALTPHLVLGGAALLLGPAFLAFGHAGIPRATGKPRAFRALLSDRPLRRAILASLAIGAAVAGPFAVLPSALEAEGSIDLAGRGTIYLFAGLGALVALPFGRPLLSRGGAPRAARYGALALAPLLLLLPLGVRGLALASVLLALATGIETLRRTALQSLVAHLPSEADRPRFLALRSLTVQLGIALGIAIAFPIWRAVGLFPTALLAALLAAGSAFLVPAPRKAAPSSEAG